MIIPLNVRTSSHIKVSVTAIKSILESAEKNIAPPLRAEDFEAIDSAILKLAIHIAAKGKLIAHHEILNGQHLPI